MITIYQIRRVDAFSSTEKKNAKYDMMLGANKWQPEFAQFYTEQYRVDTNDLDAAFEATNLWGEKNLASVERVGHQPSPSSSVGDIFVSEKGTFIVDNCGFKQIEGLMETKISITYAMAK
jgi:hypothetical protein